MGDLGFSKRPTGDARVKGEMPLIRKCFYILADMNTVWSRLIRLANQILDCLFRDSNRDGSSYFLVSSLIRSFCKRASLRSDSSLNMLISQAW